MKAFVKIYRLIKKEKPDIIHTHTAKAGTLGRLAGILYNFLRFNSEKIKLIHTFHGHVFRGYFGGFKTRLFIFIERFLSLFTNKIITVSSLVKDELVSLKIVKQDKIEVISLGFELEDFLNVSFRPESDSLNIGIVGRLAPVKNHHLFLDMAARVIRDNPRFQLKFRIIGDGVLREQLKEQAIQLGISGQVEFLGWQKNLRDIYSELDIVALTSKNEGTPVSLIEAMACGRPVVATNVGGIAGLLGSESDMQIEPGFNFRPIERGVLVTEQRSESFAFALSYVLKDSRLRREMGERGRNFVKDNFSKKRLIGDMEKLYRETLK